jgi:Fic family protein
MEHRKQKEPTKKQVREFLRESNAVERVYSEEALRDSINAWMTASKEVFMGKHDIDVDLIRAIHRRVMRRLNHQIAGKLRKVDVWVGNRKCLAPEKVEEALNYWVRACSNLKKDFEIKEAHIQFEKIHPFEDGNGRTGRIIMNIQRLKANLPLLTIHEGYEQMEYYKWFK